MFSVFKKKDVVNTFVEFEMFKPSTLMDRIEDWHHDNREDENFELRQKVKELEKYESFAEVSKHFENSLKGSIKRG